MGVPHLSNRIGASPIGRGSLQIKAVSRRFRIGGTPLTALDGIDPDILPGEFVTALGAGGCGKSTLLRLLAGTGVLLNRLAHWGGARVLPRHPTVSSI